MEMGFIDWGGRLISGRVKTFQAFPDIFFFPQHLIEFSCWNFRDIFKIQHGGMVLLWGQCQCIFLGGMGAWGGGL